MKFGEYFHQNIIFTQTHEIIDNETKCVTFSTHVVAYGIYMIFKVKL